MWMVSTSSTCLHTLPGIFEASGGGRGMLLSTTNPEDSIPPCTQEKSTQLPWCGYRENCATLLRLSGNQRYTWIFVVFEKEITSNLDYYLFNQVQKNAWEVIFTAVADLLVHVSPNLPAVFFMVCSLIFLCLKKCFSLPYCYMKQPHEQQCKRGLPIPTALSSVQSKQAQAEHSCLPQLPQQLCPLTLAMALDNLVPNFCWELP